MGQKEGEREEGEGRLEGRGPVGSSVTITVVTLRSDLEAIERRQGGWGRSLEPRGREAEP